MIYLRNLILTVAILGLIFVGHHWPRAVKPVQVDYCVQPVWNNYGQQIGGRWIPCDDLDRYENA